METPPTENGNEQEASVLAEEKGPAPASASELLFGLIPALDSLRTYSLRSLRLDLFAGLTVAEVSELTGKSVRSVEREWEKARLLLRQLMAEG